jgi:hypothetical protein
MLFGSVHPPVIRNPCHKYHSIFEHTVPAIQYDAVHDVFLFSFPPHFHFAFPFHIDFWLSAARIPWSPSRNWGRRCTRARAQPRGCSRRRHKDTPQTRLASGQPTPHCVRTVAARPYFALRWALQQLLVQCDLLSAANTNHIRFGITFSRPERRDKYVVEVCPH